jgi:hypothetical protein
MKASTAIASVLAMVVSSTAQFLDQTAAFALVVLSRNGNYNGTTLAACHEGAATEGLCIGATLGSSGVQTFTMNYSSSLTVNPDMGTVGYLTYQLVGGNFNLSSPMSLSYNPSSNVAVPLLTPSASGTEISFKADNLMGIPGYIDDTVSPPNMSDPTVYYRWYICKTNAGYLYTTAAWVMGNITPENPSCVKADLKRVFV